MSTAFKRREASFRDGRRQRGVPPERRRSRLEKMAGYAIIAHEHKPVREGGRRFRGVGQAFQRIVVAKGIAVVKLFAVS